MSSVLGTLRKNVPYLFLAAGVAWLAVALVAASAYVAWPVAACLLSGVFLKVWPGNRFTWAWAVASAAMGFLVSAYQVYAWSSFLGGEFSTLASEALAAFGVFALLHLFLLYAGGARPKPAKPTPS